MGGFSWKKAHYSPIYKLRLVNKSPKHAEDINKLTYQKTGLDWSRPVFDQSWNSWNGKGPQTGLRLRSCAVLAGPSPVQSRSFSSPGTGLPNTSGGTVKYFILCSLCDIPCTPCPIPCSPCTIPCTPCSMPCGLCAILCPPCPIPCGPCAIPYSPYGLTWRG